MSSCFEVEKENLLFRLLPCIFFQVKVLRTVQERLRERLVGVKAC